MAGSYRFKSGQLQLSQSPRHASFLSATPRGVPGSCCAAADRAKAVRPRLVHPQLATASPTTGADVALSFTCRGAQELEEASFSLSGSLTDIAAAIDHVADLGGINRVWAAATGTGERCLHWRATSRVKGVAVLGARPTSTTGAVNLARLLERHRET